MLITKIVVTKEHFSFLDKVWKGHNFYQHRVVFDYNLQHFILPLIDFKDVDVLITIRDKCRVRFTVDIYTFFFIDNHRDFGSSWKEQIDTRYNELKTIYGKNNPHINKLYLILTENVDKFVSL